MAGAYYNEINPYKAQWLRNLIAAGHLAGGDVDERSIEDVRPDDVADYDRCHFFAGIGGWGLALNWAGWPLGEGVVWTAGCPCQPFSAAGKRGGFADERHLWPAQFHLLDQCAPDVLLGEQVASPDGLAWLDLVQADMEAAGYSGGATDLCAAGFGAPHIRQRQWLTYVRLADAGGSGLPLGERDGRVQRETLGAPQGQAAIGDGAAGRLADAGGARRRQVGKGASGDEETHGSEGRIRSEPDGYNVATSHGEDGRPGPTNGRWRAADWLLCNDPGGPRWRPVEPGSFPLAHGIPGRVGRLRAYGETISPVVAAGVAAEFRALLRRAAP